MPLFSVAHLVLIMWLNLGEQGLWAECCVHGGRKEIHAGFLWRKKVLIMPHHCGYEVTGSMWKVLMTQQRFGRTAFCDDWCITSIFNSSSIFEFQVFVANPNKPKPILDILLRNQEKLVDFLTRFHTDRSEDEQFNDEKAYLIKQIKELKPLTEH